MIITYTLRSRGAGRRGTAVLFWPRTARWYLVPYVSNGFGGKDYDWDNPLPGPYQTKKAALEARKNLRAEGRLP